jgi:hypothetical protein
MKLNKTMNSKLRTAYCLLPTAYCLIICFSVIICFSAAKPDFSGKWVLDKDRSFSNPPGLEQTMNITQTGDQIRMEAHLKTAGGEQDVNDTYTVDDKEVDFTPKAPPNAKGKRKASWLPNGQGIVIEDIISVDNKTVNQLTRKWVLSPDGKRLTIDYYTDDQNRSFESKRVFTKVD